MIRSLTLSGCGVEVVRAAAGTGKTYALDAAREAWTASGHRVVGATLCAARRANCATRGSILASCLRGHRRLGGPPLRPGQRAAAFTRERSRWPRNMATVLPSGRGPTQRQDGATRIGSGPPSALGQQRPRSPSRESGKTELSTIESRSYMYRERRTARSRGRRIRAYGRSSYYAEGIGGTRHAALREEVARPQRTTRERTSRAPLHCHVIPHKNFS